MIEPHYPKVKTGRPPFPVATTLQIYFLQQWFGLSDPAMEEALYDVPLYREFASLDGGITRLPDETTILRFRHLLEAHGIAAQILAVVWIIGGKGIDIRQDRTTESRNSCKGRTSIPNSQATVWLLEDAIPGLAKNTAQITTLFALGKLWMMRKALREA
ncbi:transposase, IS4 family protein [Caballeronia temeraria]|uniref:Transposase, IS4 family protein n=1 Tax=Caballeronia temeraria TaxID=1777137 RepID=A0A158DEU2_9BURK|nr:transposase, IS4 family protein [Caballeronia temeraria]